MKKFFLSLAAIAFMFAACDPKTPDNPDNPDNPDDPDPVEEVDPIVIDGEFDDWAKLDQASVATAKNNADSPWTAVKQMRVYATEAYVYYFIEFDNTEVKEQLSAWDEAHPGLPMRININIDGEFTSGYAKYSLDAYDYIIEGSLAEKGEWTSFDGTLHQRFDGDWVELLKEGSGMCVGAGAGNKYEIALDRQVFDRVQKKCDPQAIGNVFHTGLRFYTHDWGELSNLPNSSISEGNGDGWGHLLEVTTVK